MLQSHPIPFPQDFGFLLNPFHFGGKLPVHLAKGVFLDIATPSEKEKIRGLIKEMSGLTTWGMLFQFEPIPSDVRDSPSWDRLIWPRETYWVIRGGDLRFATSLCAASQLCDCELELAATFPPDGTFGPRMIDQSSFFYYSQLRAEGDTQALDTEDAASVDSSRLQIEGFQAVEEEDETRGSIARLFERFLHVSAGKRFGELPLLAHFALIEGLVTRRRGNRGSITHQLMTKMPLLMRKFRRPLRLEDFIDISDPYKAWELLYELRSRIAHGSLGFSADDHSGLRDLSSALKFVRESLKRVFILALEEPEFISDLREC